MLVIRSMPLQFRPRLIAGLSLTRDVSSFGRESRAGETKIRIDNGQAGCSRPWIFNQESELLSSTPRRKIARRNAAAFLRCARSTITFTYFTAFRCVSRAQGNDRWQIRAAISGAQTKRCPVDIPIDQVPEVTQLKRNPTMTSHSVNKFSISNR